MIVGGGLAAMALFYFGFLRPWDLSHWFMVGAPVGRDFVNFWFGGYLALHHQLDLLVDPQAYNALISRTFSHTLLDEFVFSYPPHAILFLLPFGAMPFTAAVWLWTALNLYGLYRAARMMGGRPALAALACSAPAALTMTIYGHFDGVLALLATVALLHGRQRPWLAGCCLALMSLKPQLAVMFGIFLLLAGQWRTVAISVPMTLGLIAISVVTLGTKPWIDFVTWTVPHHAAMLREFTLGYFKSTISIYTGSRMAGLPGWAGYLLQLPFSLVVLAGAVIVYQRRGPDPRSIAIVLWAVVLALPYANAYDLALAAPALTLALFDHGSGDDRPFLPFIPALLVWIVPAFAMIFGSASWPVLPAVLAAGLLLAIARERPLRLAARRECGMRSVLQ